MHEKIIITGMGAITPLGLSVEESWRNALDGYSGVGPITLFDTSDYQVKVAAEVKDFHPDRWIDRKAAARMDRFTHFAVAASEMALDDGGLLHSPLLGERSGVIIGSGSASFEIIRNLAQKLPLMITPRWVRTRTQPIAIADVLSYLQHSADLEVAGNLVVDIGGEALRFQDMIVQAGAAMGLKRYILPVPVLSPRLSSYWLIFFTPVPHSIASALVEGLLYVGGDDGLVQVSEDGGASWHRTESFPGLPERDPPAHRHVPDLPAVHVEVDREGHLTQVPIAPPLPDLPVHLPLGQGHTVRGLDLLQDHLLRRPGYAAPNVLPENALQLRL